MIRCDTLLLCTRVPHQNSTRRISTSRTDTTTRGLLWSWGQTWRRPMPCRRCGMRIASKHIALRVVASSRVASAAAEQKSNARGYIRSTDGELVDSDTGRYNINDIISYHYITFSMFFISIFEEWYLYGYIRSTDGELVDSDTGRYNINDIISYHIISLYHFFDDIDIFISIFDPDDGWGTRWLRHWKI
jgi:hypothetical protein